MERKARKINEARIGSCIFDRFSFAKRVTDEDEDTVDRQWFGRMDISQWCIPEDIWNVRLQLDDKQKDEFRIRGSNSAKPSLYMNTYQVTI